MRTIKYIIAVVAIIAVAFLLRFEGTQAAPDLSCRYGIASPRSIVGLEDEFGRLNVCSFLNWGERPPSTLPGGIEFVHMIRTKSAPDLSHVSDLVADYPGAIWAIGNEPDTCYFYNDTSFQQDCITPEVYAQRYYDVASRIRSDDSTATILFGNIVQATELRLRYLERAWEELITQAGSESAAADLIDVWSIHSFIVNEWVGEWGTGAPEGFDCEYTNSSSDLYGKCWDESASPPSSCTSTTCWDMVHFTAQPYPQTHDNSIFNARIQDMRQWMLDHGERDKPLWITEYGSILPPVDPDGGPDYVNTSDADTADFMTGTFDFLTTTTDATTGYAADGNRLVQRWFWYSLNELRYYYGGTLYDPENGGARTAVGDAWLNYIRTFDDVTVDHWAFFWIDALYDSGITGGCGTNPLIYCPDQSVNRAQMAVFLEKGMRGASYSPPGPSGTVFGDVSSDYWAAAWIEQLAADGITAGCGGGDYCPEDPVTRAQMAIFLERAMHWPSAYSPPSGTGSVFGDVGPSYWAVDWIEQLYSDGITGGCSTSPLQYCPEDPVLRSQMAVFLVRTFNLPMP